MISERDLKDPVSFAMRRRSTGAIKAALEELDPDYAGNIDPRASAYDTLDEILRDEDIRMRIAFIILHRFYWEYLKPGSRKRITALEKELYPKGVRHGAKVRRNAAFPAEPVLVTIGDHRLDQV